MKQILFNTEMVQAILDGRKTTTRRIAKDIKSLEIRENGFVTGKAEDKYRCTFFSGNQRQVAEKLSGYKVGDILYVRETWFEGDILNSNEDIVERDIVLYATDDLSEHDIEEIKWRPSIHMPKRLARIFLRVTDVRVERLQDIDDGGAKAEGSNVGIGIAEKMKEGAIDRFKRIWNGTVNKKDMDKYGWDANPYVWVIEFERIEKSEVEQ